MLRTIVRHFKIVYILAVHSKVRQYYCTVNPAVPVGFDLSWNFALVTGTHHFAGSGSDIFSTDQGHDPDLKPAHFLNNIETCEFNKLIF